MKEASKALRCFIVKSSRIVKENRFWPLIRFLTVFLIRFLVGF